MMIEDYTSYMKLFDVLSTSGFKKVNQILYRNAITKKILCLEYADSTGSIYLADILRIRFNAPFPKGLETILPEGDIIIKYDNLTDRNIMQIDFIDKKFSDVSLIDEIFNVIKENFDIKKVMKSKPKISMKHFEQDYRVIKIINEPEKQKEPKSSIRKHYT